MSEAALWLTAVAALPVLVIAVSLLDRDVDLVRRVAVVAAIGQVLAALVNKL